MEAPLFGPENLQCNEAMMRWARDLEGHPLQTFFPLTIALLPIATFKIQFPCSVYKNLDSYKA